MASERVLAFVRQSNVLGGEGVYAPDPSDGRSSRGRRDRGTVTGSVRRRRTGVPGLREGQVPRQRQRVDAAAVHPVLQPGHARERRQVGQRGRNDAHGGDAVGQPRSGLQLRAGQRLPVQLPHPGLGQPAADLDGRPARGGAARRDQEVVRGRRGALPEHQVAAGRQRAAARPARLRALGQPGQQLQRQRQLRASAGWRQWHGRHRVGLDPELLPAGEAVLPQHEADAQRLQHHQLRQRDHAVPADRQHPQAREPARRHRRTGPRVLDHRQHGGAQGEPRSPRRHRDPDPDHRARHRRAGGRRRRRRRGPAAQLPPDRPGLLGAPRSRGHHGLGLAPAQPLAQRAERADRALHRCAQAGGARGSTTMSARSPRRSSPARASA